MTRVREWAALVTGLATLLLLPGAASAAPVTIGQLAPGTSPSANCVVSPFDSLQPTVTSGNTYVVPVGGAVVTAWSTNAAAGAGQMLKMKIFRPAGGDTYTVVGHDGPRALTPSTVNTFSTRIPVQPGDVLGENDVNASSVPNACTFDVSGENNQERNGDLADGMSGTFFADTGTRQNVTAVVLFPPAITAIAPGSGGSGGGTPVTITGHDFTDASAVNFGPTPARSFTVNFDGSISAVSPAHSSGTVDISVTTPAGQTAPSASDHFTFVKKCVVPKLKGKKLKKAKKALKKAHCRLGKVRGKHRKHGKVKRQKPKPGTILPAGSKVNIRF